MLAACNGQLRAARILASRMIKFDLDIDIRDSKGYTALLHAIKNQNYGIAYDLIKYDRSNIDFITLITCNLNLQLKFISERRIFGLF